MGTDALVCPGERSSPSVPSRDRIPAQTRSPSRQAGASHSSGQFSCRSSCDRGERVFRTDCHCSSPARNWRRPFRSSTPLPDLHRTCRSMQRTLCRPLSTICHLFRRSKKQHRSRPCLRSRTSHLCRLRRSPWGACRRAHPCDRRMPSCRSMDKLLLRRRVRTSAPAQEFEWEWWTGPRTSRSEPGQMR
jgi:hypothetical protein